MPSGILEFPWSIALSNNFTDRFWLYAEQGLLDFSENIIVAPEPNPTFNIKIMHRTILGDTVIFSYPLRKYRGNDGVASNITINSSAKCKRRPVHAIGHDTSVSLPTIVGTCTYTWFGLPDNHIYSERNVPSTGRGVPSVSLLCFPIFRGIVEASYCWFSPYGQRSGTWK